MARRHSRMDPFASARRFSAGRLLALVWAVTLALIAAGAVWLEMTHDPGETAQIPATDEVLTATAPPPPDDNPAGDDRPAKAVSEDTAPARDRAAAPENAPPANMADAQLAKERPQPGPDARISLAPAPDPALVETGEDGTLPRIARDGRQPWQVYSRPYLADPGAPRIAIVIQDIGLSARDTGATLEAMPPEVTLAISPYADDPGAVARRARRDGHEVLVMIPMEPVAYPENDPGPHTLLVTQPAGERLARLRYVLSRFQGHVGGLSHMGSRLTAQAEAIRPVLTELKARGLLFLDARTTPSTRAASVAGEIGLPRAISDLYIDADVSVAAIRDNLLELERTARSGGVAIGIARPYPVSLREIAAWLDGLATQGIELAPVSATVDLQRGS